MTITRVAAFILSILAGPIASQSQEAICKPEDTFETCEAAIENAIRRDSGASFSQTLAREEVDADLLERIEASVPAEVALVTVGDLPDINFVDRLGLSFSSRALDGNDQALAIGVPIFGDRLKVEILVREAEVFGKILEQLPKDTKEERTKELGKELDDFDNLTVGLSWQLLGTSTGREPEDHQLMLDRLIGSAPSPSTTSTPGPRIQTPAFQRASRELEECEAPPETRNQFQPAGDSNRTPIGELWGPNMEECLAKLERLVGLRQSGALARLAAVKPVLDTYASLISGQPQLSLSAEVAVRDDLVGPEEDRVKVTYEFGQALFGGRNINGLRSECGPSPSLVCYGDYFTKTEAKKDRKGTLSVGATWSRSSAYELFLPDDGVAVDIDRREKIAYRLAYEYPFGKKVEDSGDPPKFQRKIVVGGSYEEWISGTDEKDRGLLEATFSQRVSDDVSATFGFVWANRPEFLEEADIDKEVTAKLGLSFRIGPNPEKK